MVRRLVEDQAVDAARREQREPGARALARRERRGAAGRRRPRRARTSRAACARPSPSSRTARAKSSSSMPANRSRAWFSSPKTVPVPDAPRAARERQVADSARMSVVLPEPFGPTIASRSPQRELEVERAERERADLDATAPASSAMQPGRRRRGELRAASRHGRPRLLDLLEPLEVVLRLRSPCRAARSCRGGPPSPVRRASLRSPPSRCASSRRVRAASSTASSRST